MTFNLEENFILIRGDASGDGVFVTEIALKWPTDSGGRYWRMATSGRGYELRWVMRHLQDEIKSYPPAATVDDEKREKVMTRAAKLLAWLDLYQWAYDDAEVWTWPAGK